MMLQNIQDLNMFYRDALYNFRTKLNCFVLFNNRTVEGKIYNLKEFSFIDIGFKYLIPISKNLSTDTLILKITKIESTINDFHFDYNKFKNDHSFKVNWFLIKKAFANKCILKGKILNYIYNGFSVGVCGFVGFLPTKYSIINKYSLNSIFIITNIDYFKNTFTLSQSRIDKTSLKVLFRLSSQLSYILKTNFGEHILNG